MKYFVGVTDKAWFSFLAARRAPEVNFWRPGGASTFRAVSHGSPFLFKLHAPDNFIVGGGFFVKYDALPLSLAWEAFGENNGASDIDTLSASIRGYRKDGAIDPVIGCVVLAEPFFFERADWIPIPADWAPNIVQGKTYDTAESTGAALWREVSDRLLAQNADLGADLLKDAAMNSEANFGGLYLARARLGQGAFRVLVTSAYSRRCAVSGERVLPALEAAHIKPHSKSGPNRVTNGLLLRSDIHRLFDRGYVTVLPDLMVEVSPAIREEFENGREYYAFRGHSLVQVPQSGVDRPSGEYLEWHNANVFMA